ncbi:SAM-dependent methyltransferase [Phycicoccus flavus]|uniref:SAM-dependent methyltransferase n=1 Tax=Phycicoccus flavus TaxID=2502783 RepID=UPI000FEC1BC7|nr:SAM-dependent methyltransferase [Phycicoccus flavus]NHA69671.1 hypothetical protein [Phycicoccus flavus]
MAEPRPWREAWQDALYGPAGFYRSAEGPAGHFTTSAHGPLGPLLAEAVAALADREGAVQVLDLGAGRGELLTALHAHRPDLWLTGVDVVERPPGLPDAVRWIRSPGGDALPDRLTDLVDVLVVAHEWLDVIPCTVAEVDDEGRARVVLVDAGTGAETLGPDLDAEDAAWVAAHWPTDGAAPGTRVEVGLARDRAWDALAARVRRGTLLAVDYGHVRAGRPPHGTLVGHRRGTVVPAVPDGSCDVTAHVAVDTLEQDERWTQREALERLGVDGRQPPVPMAGTDPLGYLAALNRAGTVGVLRDPSGLGAFHWVLRRVGRPGPGAAD